jgi:hypothetical protein
VEAAKYGLATFQISLPLDRGALARMGSEVKSQPGKWLFTGSAFYLLTDKSTLLSRDQRWDQQRLYPCGTRMHVPLEGEPALVNAYSVDLEIATDWALKYEALKGGGLPPEPEEVIEPIIETAESHGLGLPVGKQLVVTDAALVKDSQNIVVHTEQKDFPARVLKVDTGLGVALLATGPELELEPGRWGTKKDADLGQAIFAVGLEMTISRKAFTTTPTLSKGIVSKLGGRDSGSFLHDAALPTESVGGYVITEKGDVLGAYFRSSTRLVGKRGAAATRAKEELASSTEETPGLPESLRCSALAKFVAETPGVLPFRALGADELPEAVKALRNSSLLVISTRELRKDPPPRKKPVASTPETPMTPGSGTTPPPDGAMTYSLSKSGVRHNSKCKFFRADLPCQAADGRPCKVCGG